MSVTVETDGAVVVFRRPGDGGWACIQHPGWTTFGDTPAEAFAVMQEKHPVEANPRTAASSPRPPERG